MAVFVDRPHDVEKARVDFFARPGNAHAVLRHLETGRRDAAGVGGLPGTEKDLRLEELIHAVDRGRHVRAF